LRGGGTTRSVVGGNRKHLGRTGRSLALLLTLFTTPTLAQGILPFDGAFGNDAGCHLWATGEMQPGYALLTPDTFSSEPIGCDFGTLASFDGVVFIVDAVCSPGGKSTVRVSDLGAAGYAVSVDNHDGLVRGLSACPPVDTDPSKVHA
jgi:hypothetical protein